MASSDGTMRALVGTSGYAYKEWKGRFYPEHLPDKQMLRAYAEHFRTVEINNTFYRMPTAQALDRWAEQVPDDFSFVLKAPRRITHLGRLKNVEQPVGHLLEAVQRLGNRLGPLLFQLPPYMRVDLDRLRAFLGLLPERTRVAMEFRHRSWFDDSVYDLLRDHDVAMCISDGEIKGGEVPFVVTAAWGYLRLRGVEYADDQLEQWVERVRGQAWRDAYVFFKHEDEATGPALAKRFLSRFPG